MIELGTNKEGVDENDFLTSRSCIIAQSGAGKSYGVAVICEELSRLNLGFCIIDTEGEYFSLKQGFDVLWVGLKDADVNINSVDFKKLAYQAIKEGVPIIFDVSEVIDEKKTVNDFVTALFEVADELRNPYLLIVEEADKFIPQKGEKLTIFYDVARRGRKRGLGLLVASQRPALVDKEVLSQCNHQFIGKLTVENDIDASRYFFNSRKNLLLLPDLKPGEFFMSGFKPQETLFKFKTRVTDHTSSTPIIKERLPAKIKDIISLVNNTSKKSGPGVEALINKEDADLIALNNCKRKFLFFGERETVESVKFMYKPIIELSLKVFNKKLLRGEEFVNSYTYITPEFIVVDKEFNTRFDLSKLKGLPERNIKVLIALFYEHARTIADLISKVGISEVEARTIIKGLSDSGVITHSGWNGKYKVFEVLTKFSIPKVISLCTDKVSTSVEINENYTFDVNIFKQLIKSLDSKTDVVESKVIYYPFYKVVLRSSDVTRELFINGVNGRVL